MQSSFQGKLAILSEQMQLKQIKNHPSLVMKFQIISCFVRDKAIPKKYFRRTKWSYGIFQFCLVHISKRNIPGDKAGQIGQIPIPPSLLAEGSRKTYIPEDYSCRKLFRKNIPEDKTGLTQHTRSHRHSWQKEA